MVRPRGARRCRQGAKSGGVPSFFFPLFPPPTPLFRAYPHLTRHPTHHPTRTGETQGAASAGRLVAIASLGRGEAYPRLPNIIPVVFKTKGANVHPRLTHPFLFLDTGALGQDIRGALPRRRAGRARVHRRRQARVLPPRRVQAMARHAGIATTRLADPPRGDPAGEPRKANPRRRRNRLLRRSVRPPAARGGWPRVGPVRTRGAVAPPAGRHRDAGMGLCPEQSDARGARRRPHPTTRAGARAH